MEFRDLRIIANQSLSQGIVHCVDGAIAFRSGVQQLALHTDFDHRFRKDTASLTVLNVDEKVHEFEGRFITIFLTFQHHGDRCFSGLKRESARLKLLDVVEHANDFFAFHFHAVFFGFTQQVSGDVAQYAAGRALQGGATEYSGIIRERLHELVPHVQVLSGREATAVFSKSVTIEGLFQSLNEEQNTFGTLD